MAQKLSRHHPARHAVVERRNQPAIVFLTICTKDRKKVFDDAHIQRVILQAWASTTQWQVGHYLLMPDHIHLFCSPCHKESEPIRQWVAYWKRLVSIKLPELKPLWQRHVWDTQLRHANHYADKWNYVRENPVRAGLAETSDDWPYQGCVTELRW